MLNNWKTRPDSYTITIEQNVQFQVEIYHEKIPLNQIQNDRPTATFDFNMRNNWKTVPDSWTITIEQNVRLLYCMLLITSSRTISIMVAGYPVNTKHLYNICTMLGQCRRRWADVVQMLYKCFVFAGYCRVCSCLPGASDNTIHIH